MWYKNSYRRHLCDMHINDGNPLYLSLFSPEEYLENLKKANIDTAMLYFQSHVGLCYFPTKTGKMHPAFCGREASMKRLTEMCRESGINVVGYYSLIYDNYAHDTHPEWRMVDKNGKSQYEHAKSISAEFASGSVCRYGICCPNNPDYREFVEKQIEEIADYFTVDGMFFDMLFWPQVCFCKHCRNRWEKETGLSYPSSFDINDDKWLLLMEKRRKWMGEFAHFAADTAKRLMPGISVEHNLACAVLPDGEKGLASEVICASDYAGGDLYGDKYAQSFTCKAYKGMTRNQPFEYMFSRCVQSLSKHTVTKSPDEMESAVFLSAAHHGATLVIDAIDPCGTLDGRIYEQVGNVFEKLMPYEKHFVGEMLADIGIYYSLKSKFDLHGQNHTNHGACVNLVKTFVRENILCAITGELSTLADFNVLIAPNLTEQDAPDFERIINYVKNGGKLYISGADCLSLIKEFFGAKLCGRSQETVTYIAPANNKASVLGNYTKDYPLHFDGSLPILNGFDENCVLAHITLPYTTQNVQDFASIHSNPPGISTNHPALAFTKYGKGAVLWSAACIEEIEAYNYRTVFTEVIKEFFSFVPTVVSDAPRDVEITAFENDNEIYINTVLLCDDDKARKVEPFEIKVRCESIPGKIELLPDKKAVPFEHLDGYAVFESQTNGIFGMYKLIF